jgi:hypothetical protein
MFKHNVWSRLASRRVRTLAERDVSTLARWTTRKARDSQMSVAPGAHGAGNAPSAGQRAYRGGPAPSFRFSRGALNRATDAAGEVMSGVSARGRRVARSAAMVSCGIRASRGWWQQAIREAIYQWCA